MKTKFMLLSLSIASMLAGCQTATPASLVANLNDEFTLAPGQSAAITDTDLTITFLSVLSDDRCPSEVECAASGPVTIALSVQPGNDSPSDVRLQTFTDQNGRAPSGSFEGMEDRVEVGDYLIRVTGVLPYPSGLSSEIKASDYQVTLLVTPN